MMLLNLLAAGLAFTCTPAAIWDGDTFTCSDGRKVRVAAIAAREVKRVNGRMVDAGCSPGHPCPTTSGLTARNGLADLFGGARGVGRNGHLMVSGPLLRCMSNGSAGRDRTGAWCRTPAGQDVSCAMVRQGYALRWRNHGGDQVCSR